MDSALTPAFATDADDIDDLLGTVGAGSARRLYDGQKADLVAVVSRLRGAPSVQSDRARAAVLLHMVAGTAAYFGDNRFGEVARAAEQAMVDPADCTHIAALCDRLLSFIEVR